VDNVLQENGEVKVFLHVKNRETGEVRILEQESDTYEEGRDVLTPLVEDGWYRLHWQTDILDRMFPDTSSGEESVGE
jgi:hypothetical protein